MGTPRKSVKVSAESEDKSPRNFRWIQLFEDTLIELLLRESRNGNIPDMTFTPTAYRNIVHNFNRIHGTMIMKKHIQSRIKTMKAHFIMFHGAFNGLSGFAWNNETNTFEAEDELWDQRIKEDPKFGRFRHKSCYNWDKLSELFGDTRARGDCASGVKEKSLRMKRGLDLADDMMTGQFRNASPVCPTNSSSYGDYDIAVDLNHSPSFKDVSSSQQTAIMSGGKQKRKSELVNLMEEGYKTMAASIDNLSKALAETGATVAASKFDPSQNTLLLEALTTLPIEEDYKVRSFVYLSGKPSKAALIVAAPPLMREKILEDIMKSG